MKRNKQLDNMETSTVSTKGPPKKEHSESDHSHKNTPASRLRFVFVFTFLFMIVEAVVGTISNSLALLADAGHMLNDVVSIGLALFALHLSTLKKTPKYTFGYNRVEVLSGLVNGVSLLGIAIYIVRESFLRFEQLDKLEINGALLLITAFIGLVVNVIGIYLLSRDKDGNLNIEGAYEHVLADLLGSVAALIAGIGIILFKAYWLDLVVSVIVSILIVKSGLSITIRAVKILIEASPEGMDPDNIRNDILAIEGVNGVFDFHLWRVTDGMDLLTAHVIIEEEERSTEIMKKATRIAKGHGLHHVTIQIELGPCDDEGNCCF